MSHPVIVEARTYIGAPWIHMQRSKFGCDCVGFLMAVGASFGLDGSKVENYCRHPQGDSLVQAMRAYLVEIPLEQIQVGDFLVFRIYKTPTHVGILSYNDFLIHAEVDRLVAEVPFDLMWKRRLVAAFRLPAGNIR